ncbi:MAG: glycosyltransferase family 4 protein [Pseudomonadota bacterium]
MRILVLAPQPFVVQRGTPIAVRMLLETLSARGDDIDILTFPEGKDVDIPRCRIHRVPALPGVRHFPPGFSAKKLVADAMMMPMAAWRMIRHRYDLVIAVEEAAFIAMALRLFFRVAYLADFDSSMPEQLDDKFSLPGWVRRILDRAEGMMVRHSTGAITCCRALEEIVRRHAPDIAVCTLEDVTMLDPDIVPEPPKDCHFNGPVVMYVGNLESYQGVDLLMEGFAELDPEKYQAHLVIIGGGREDIDAGELRAGTLGISARTHFLGPRPVADLGAYLSAATVTASPRTQGRNTPMKIYSYLDSGRPLVATRLTTHTQVLDDQIAMLVEPTAADMARGLAALLDDPDLRARMGDAARARVTAEFTPEAYRRKLNRFLSDHIEPRLSSTQKSSKT